MSTLEFKKFTLNNVDYGHFAETHNVFLFFGNKNFTKERFSLFPHIKFQTLKQIHSDKTVYIEKYTESEIEADAQYTAQKKLALAIQTADCLPILCFDQKEQWICAIHAGWRGVEKQITKRAIEKLGRSSNAFAFSFFVGPHIQQESFQIDKDVSDLLIKCTEKLNNYSYHHVKENKYYVSLKSIFHAQLEEMPIKILDLQMSKVDTLKNDNYSSFRREKAFVRNWSFIYLK